ncbi:L,D-transpeptidase [Thermithiobacillus plumbiphilus]|uniref:L,D-transpeptidase n=1 Tax=Thermithiobacillus plumbiphilus TaxID=1729899 RepID=A0ABU9D9K8_9PROT
MRSMLYFVFAILLALPAQAAVPQPMPSPGQIPVIQPVENFGQIHPERVQFQHIQLPLQASSGPSVLAAQILLDRARFSPGVLDGHWGKNTTKALFWFQKSRDLPATGKLDRPTLEQLARAAAAPVGALVQPYVTAPEDAAARFKPLPAGIYERANLSWLGYESALEALSERFHSTSAVLRQLNPQVDFQDIRPGTRIFAPAVDWEGDKAPHDVRRIVVSATGFYTQGLDAQGQILFHYPSTLGSEYDPLPLGTWRAERIAFKPKFHYQPRLFHDVPDSNPEAMLPPGPNSPVGLVWIALSKPHYGIHGTSEPQSIGYTSSHGCVRLTNWDAWELARHVAPGTPVVFQQGR